jgi:mannosyltransferase OCH1-like enzyme
LDQTQPLRRLITPIRFGDKAFKSKRYAVFDQTFFEKVCGQAFSQKGCDHSASRDFDQTFSQKVCVFDQTFFEKVCEQAFFEKVCEQAFFEKVCEQAFFEKVCGKHLIFMGILTYYT